MIEVQRDGRGNLRIRSDAGDVSAPDSEGFVELSAEAVGELVREAAIAPDQLPQPDARVRLGGSA